MRLPWRKKARLIEPSPMVALNVQELQTAKEILSEVFHARPSDVEEMIQKMAFRFFKTAVVTGFKSWACNCFKST